MQRAGVPRRGTALGPAPAVEANRPRDSGAAPFDRPTHRHTHTPNETVSMGATRDCASRTGSRGRRRLPRGRDKDPTRECITALTDFACSRVCGVYGVWARKAKVCNDLLSDVTVRHAIRDHP